MGRGFFALSSELAVTTGDTISVSIRADLVGDDYVWTWDTSLVPIGSTEATRHFRQSTFSVLLSSQSLRRRQNSYSSHRSEDGSIYHIFST